MLSRFLSTGGVSSVPASSLPVVGWNCFVFDMITGAIVAELPLNADPQYSRLLNQPGNISVTVQIGGNSVSGANVRPYVGGFRYGLAISWGPPPSGFIVQAGPIMTASFDDTEQGNSTLTIGAGGFWSYLNHLYQINSAWTGSLPITDNTANTAYSGSYHDIVIAMLTNALGLQTLPLTLPSTDGLGGQTMGYYGYDLAMVGERLTQLVQLNQAPDIDFYPEFTDSAHIGWTLLIGTPLVPSTNIFFDYGSGLTSVTTDVDASNLCNYAWAKGNGTEAGLLYGVAENLSSLAGGWPRLDFVDATDTSETIQQNLTNLALADVVLYSQPVEVWTATVRADQYPVFGSYTPGSWVTLNMQNHPWIPNGEYTQRLLGLSQGQNAAEVVLALQAVQGGTV